MRYKPLNRFYLLLLFLIFVHPLFSQDFNEGYSLFEKGTQAYNNNEFQSAIEYFNRAEDIFSIQKGNMDLTAYTCMWRGLAYYRIYDYENAKKNYLDAIREAEQNGYKDIIVASYTYLAQSSFSVDDFAMAYDYYKEALYFAEIYEQAVYFPAIFEGIGNVEFAWGRYDSAEQYYNKALEYAEEQNAEQNIISLFIDIGRVYYARNEFNNAIKLYEQILLRPDITQSTFYVTILNSIGMAYFSLGNNEQALNYYNLSFEIAEEQNNIFEIIRLYIHIGGVYFKMDEFEKAIDTYSLALPLTEQIHRVADRSVCLFNIGQAYLYLGEHQKAVPYFKQSVELKEQLRLSASGTRRLDYLSSEVHVYQWLALTYLDMEDYESALNTLEFSSARYLKEQLLEQSDKDILFSGISSIQKNMKPDELIIEYGSSSTPWLSLITISDREINGEFLFPYEITELIPDNFVSEYNRLNESHRGLVVSQYDTKLNDIQEPTFEDLITYYRLLLVSGSNEEQLRQFGRLLYDFLIAPVEDQLETVESITIIPTGILGFLPFETLITDDGKYLIEKFDISYVQSLAVAEITSERIYSAERNDFIGFGGAAYDNFSPDNYPEQYGALIKSYWANLPGTAEELKNIRSFFGSPVVYSGEDVSETIVKNLSFEEELKNYRIIHFATHGLVIPEYPELSALVLTDSNNEDGYLTSKEIADLDIEADFVNLSACETGLGKIYGGEGIVGLAQSFLIAGANSLSVSLWQVPDISTKDFMIGFYELAINEGYSFKQAISMMKRRFIQSEEYSHPLYWAPFIFYGE